MCYGVVVVPAQFVPITTSPLNQMGMIVKNVCIGRKNHLNCPARLLSLDRLAFDK